MRLAIFLILLTASTLFAQESCYSCHESYRSFGIYDTCPRYEYPRDDYYSSPFRYHRHHWPHNVYPIAQPVYRTRFVTPHFSHPHRGRR